MTGLSLRQNTFFPELHIHNSCIPDDNEFLSLQIHRRGRALRKFAKQLTEGQVVLTPRSLQHYIMPYAMTALLDEKMQKVTDARNILRKKTSVV